MTDIYPKQAIAVLASVEALENALDRLEEAGFDHERLSVVSRKDVIEGKLERVHSPVDAARLTESTHRDAPMRKVEMNELRAAAIGFPAYAGAIIAGSATIAATGGLALPVILATAAGGAGGALLGGLFSRFLDSRRARYFDEQLSSGGIILWVLLKDAEEERKALKILPSFSIERVLVEEPVEEPLDAKTRRPGGQDVAIDHAP